MLLGRLVIFVLAFVIGDFALAEHAWAWGPAIHTVIGTRILTELRFILPTITGIIQAYPLEYLYGSLSADFFVGKGQKRKAGHSHNWESGLKFLGEAWGDREASYAYGFLSHLAADVAAHNYFIPNIIHSAPTWKRMGHLIAESWADSLVPPLYMKMARTILNTEDLDCDDLLKNAVGRNNGLWARRRLYMESVKLSDLLSTTKAVFFGNRGSSYQTSSEYLVFMIDLSYRLVKDFLQHPNASVCLSYDPIGSDNLRVARRSGLISKLFHIPQNHFPFTVDRELLML
jgi:hypothetical protein